MVETQKTNWIEYMNDLGKSGTPFLFVLDFELNNPYISPLSDLDQDILYKCNEHKNYQLKGAKSKPIKFEKSPISFEVFSNFFTKVQKEIFLGNSFLLNLTFPTHIETNYTLKELFEIAHAKYKLYFKDKFIVSSPETFVQILNGKIYTFPMKGTIDASIAHAREIILEDVKETAEHHTIVDLLRNDLSIIAKNVKVNRFRYIDELRTSSKTLLQVSSEIEGVLPTNYKESLGDIFNTLLPAGSISGAPKKKTIEIIKANEIDDRGYYTGVFGIFDGQNVDSGVMIRYIEQKNGSMTYRSGSGITSMSECQAEFKELIDKVYVPLGRKY